MNSYPGSVDPWAVRLAKTTPRLLQVLVIVVAVAMVISAMVGCEYFPEATFQLASESRLPKWITLPPGLTRADVSITMSYYIVPLGGRSVFVLQDTKGKTLEKVYGETKCGVFLRKNHPPGFPVGYPAYQEVVVNGTKELIEHRKMEPVFYLTDDTAVWNEFRDGGCR